MAEGHEAPHEPLDVLDILDLAYFDNGQDLVGVRFNAAFVDVVPQELTPGDPKGPFFWVRADVEMHEFSEGFLQVDDVLGLYDNVVDIDLQVVPDLPF
jgi:hypothetical protein